MFSFHWMSYLIWLNVFPCIFECLITDSSTSTLKSEYSKIFIISSQYGKIMFFFLISNIWCIIVLHPFFSTRFSKKPEWRYNQFVYNTWAFLSQKENKIYHIVNHPNFWAYNANGDGIGIPEDASIKMDWATTIKVELITFLVFIILLIKDC